MTSKEMISFTVREGEGERFYYVEHGGDVIGSIEYFPQRDKPYLAYFHRSNKINVYSRIGSFKTLFEAKLGIIREFRENGFCKSTTQSQTTNVGALPNNPNAEFYPTPSKLAGMMLANVDLKTVSTVLEPSAGKGDLCIAMHKMYNKEYHSLSMDCIEIDPDLQGILISKGLNIVYDDFLSFETQQKYDLIIMNPPFSMGDLHLLKAIQLQEHYGGQIVCLLNAETLRNAYTNSRKLLAQKISQYRARIRYVSDAFKHAERKTNVEVAIVYINIPAPTKKSFILEGLKAAEEYERSQKVCTDQMLTSNNWIDKMVGEYNFEVKAITRFIEEYEAIKPYIYDTRDSFYTYKKPLLELNVYGTSDLSVNEALKKVRRKYWNDLFCRPELTCQFTSNLRDSYKSQIDELANCDFNKFNITKILARMNAELIDGVKESIKTLFEKMTQEHSYWDECKKNIHYYTGWKTNKAHCVGKKVILPVNGFSAYSFSKGKLDFYHCLETLSDLEKAFNYLDGHSTSNVSLSYVLEQANNQGITKNIHCKYFDVTFYKKGTMHLTFTVPHVVDALNIYMGKENDWLPPYYGKVSYEDLSKEEQVTVDEFQGREEYQKVFGNQSLYLIDISSNSSNILALGTGNGDK